MDTSIVKEYKHIVFGFEHYNPLGIVRSLGEAGIRPIGIIVKGLRPITSKSKYLSEVYMVDSIEEGYNLLLHLYGNEEKKPFVYASDDQVTNYMDERYNELKEKFFFYNAGAAGRVAEYQNKANILRLASKHGINYLKTIEVKKGEIPEGLEYPIITKAIMSTIDDWKSDMIICHNEEELQEAYKVIRSEKILLQKYIYKKNELCMEGYVVNHGKNSVITIASTYNYLMEDSYSPYMTTGSFDNEELRKKLAAMFEDIGFEGIFEVEFLVDQDEKLYFLEINFRNSTWSYASTVAGMDLPLLWAEGMIDPGTTENSRKKIDKPFTAMVEFDDFRARVKTKKISFKQWYKEFKNSKCKYYCASKDYKPVLSVIFAKLKRSI